MAEVLSSSAPKGRKWTKVQEDEEKLEAELSNAPTEDIASRLIEQSVKIFKIADYSGSMKGSLVSELQGALALVRAATSVMAIRARKSRGNEDIAELRKEMERLRAENQRLKREMEKINSRFPPPATSHPSFPTQERRSSAKRRRIADSTDSEERRGTRPPSNEHCCPSPLVLWRREERETAERKGNLRNGRPLSSRAYYNYYY